MTNDYILKENAVNYVLDNHFDEILNKMLRINFDKIKEAIDTEMQQSRG